MALDMHLRRFAAKFSIPMKVGQVLQDLRLVTKGRNADDRYGRELASGTINGGAESRRR